MLHTRSNYDILQDLDNYVSGHIEAKKSLISLVNRSKIRHHQKWVEGIHKDYLLPPHKLLLIGQSGTGKTHLVETLHDLVEFPLIRLDATKLNPTGAAGGVKEEDVRKMIVTEAAKLVEQKKGTYHSLAGAVDQMVVFIDEIDKLGQSVDSSGNWNSHVQSNFLTLFDHKSEFSGVSFIFAGAFSGLTGTHKHAKPGIGFHPSSPPSQEEIDEVVVGQGLLPELVGRLTQVVELDKFSEEDYYHILVDRLIPKKLLMLAFFNVFDIDLTESDLRLIAKNAFKSGQGIRSLQRQLDRHYAAIEFENEYKLNKPPRLGIIEGFDI